MRFKASRIIFKACIYFGWLFLYIVFRVFILNYSFTYVQLLLNSRSANWPLPYSNIKLPEENGLNVSLGRYP